jgi:ferredoxin
MGRVALFGIRQSLHSMQTDADTRGDADLEKPINVIHVVDRAGAEHELEAVEGWRIMEILRDYGMGMGNTCGGSLACAECHVILDAESAARVPPPREDELEKLDELPMLYEHSRLCCQIIWSDDLDGLRLTIAKES